MKVQLENGSWLVAMGLGLTAHAEPLEDAEQLERGAYNAMTRGIAIGVFLSLAIGIFVVFKCQG